MRTLLETCHPENSLGLRRMPFDPYVPAGLASGFPQGDRVRSNPVLWASLTSDDMRPGPPLTWPTKLSGLPAGRAGTEIMPTLAYDARCAAGAATEGRRPRAVRPQRPAPASRFLGRHPHEHLAGAADL